MRTELLSRVILPLLISGCGAAGGAVKKPTTVDECAARSPAPSFTSRTTGFEQSGDPVMQEHGPRVAAALRSAWSASDAHRRRVCTDDVDVLRAERMRCLDSTRAALEALPELLAAQASVRIVRAHDVLLELRDLEHVCAHTGPAEHEQRDEIERVIAMASGAVWQAAVLRVLTEQESALGILDAAAQGSNASDAWLQAERAQVLLALERYAQARDAAAAVVEAFTRAGRTTQAAHVELILASALAQLGEPGAREHALGAVERLVKHVGGDSVAAARGWYALGGTFAQARLYEDALEADANAVAAWSTIHGTDDLRVANTRNLMAVALDRLGRKQNSLELNEQVLLTRTGTLGATHPDTLITRNNIAFMQAALGDHVTALRIHQEVVAIRARLYADDVSSLGISLAGVASQQMALGRTAEAIATLEDAVARMEKGLGVHSNVAWHYAVLGNMYERAGSLAKAITAHQRCYDLYVELRGASHPDVVKAAERLKRAQSK